MADARIPESSAPISLFGIGVRIHVSWLIFAIFVAWMLAAGELPMLYEGLPPGAYWGMAAMIVVGIAISIVLHELAHALVGRAFGVTVNRITLFLFGGVAELREEPKGPGAELAMAAAGPAFSIVLSVVLAVAAGAAEATGAAAQVVIALRYLSLLNLVLAVFNLVPAFPLDGGRILRAVIWMITRDPGKATRAAARAGEFLALLLMGLGLLALFGRGVAGGLWWILIGLFIYGAARGTLKDLELKEAYAGHSVSEIMVRPVEAVSADMTLDRFVDERLLASRHGLYPVVREGKWKGSVTPDDILRAPRERWPEMTLGDVCTPADLTPTVSPTDDAAKVLERMQRHGAPRMLVVDRSSVVGVVTLADLLGRLELARRFGQIARAP